MLKKYRVLAPYSPLLLSLYSYLYHLFDFLGIEYLQQKTIPNKATTSQKFKSTKTKSKTMYWLVQSHPPALLQIKRIVLSEQLRFEINSCCKAQRLQARYFNKISIIITMYIEWPLIYSYPVLQYVPQQPYELYIPENPIYSNYSALQQTEIAQLLPHTTDVGRSSLNLEAERNARVLKRKQQNNQIKENFQQIKSQQAEETKRNKNGVYPKKNAESNLINQIFSFLSSKSKSYYILLKILQNNELKVAFYYDLMKNLKSQTKKYINRFFIKKLIEIDSDHFVAAYIRESTSTGKIEVLELRRLFRMLINYYFNNVCSNILLTSTKLNRESRKQHLRRKREVESFLIYHAKLNNTKVQKSQTP